MANIIPGLSYIPVNEEDKHIEIRSFTKTMKIPESHRYGNCRPRDDFERLGVLYEGNFATLYKCKDKRNGEVYALKKFLFTPDMMKNGIPISFLREVNVLKLLKHENIVNSHGTVAGKKLDSNFLLLDYCNTSLQELIDKKCDGIYDTDVVKYMMKQLLDGISFIHESTIVHRNISCRNLLFNESGTLKLSGFRTARFYDPKGMSPEMSELTYRAPELLFKAKYGFPADIWSVGCVFAYLLLKKQLFVGDTETEVLSSMFSIIGTPSESIWPGFDKILQKGTNEEKIIKDSQPYSDIKIVLSGVPDLSSQLLQDIIIYYPGARLSASELLKSPYMLETPPECTSEKMKSILGKALSVSQLLDDAMQVDS